MHNCLSRSHKSERMDKQKDEVKPKQATKAESVELTDEEKALNITKLQKERMEMDHDMIKDYYKVGIG